MPHIKNALTFINAQDTSGRTALMYAIIHDNVDIADALLPYAFSSIYLQDSLGKTALTYALEKRNVSLAQKILSYYVHFSHVNPDKTVSKPIIEDLRVAAEEKLYIQTGQLLGYLKGQPII